MIKKMTRTLEDDLADLIKKHSITPEELIKAINSKPEKDTSKPCKICGTNQEIKVDFSSLITFSYCRICERGHAIKNIIVRAKKTTKSLGLDLIDRGHTIRYYNKDNTQDLIHFNVYFPKDIELRSRDEVTIEIPFFTSENSLLKAISRCKSGLEAIKILDTIKKLESKITKTYDIPEFYYFSSIEEHLVSLTWEAESLKREIINDLEDGCISDIKEKSKLKQKVKALLDFEKNVKSLYELINNDSATLSLVITLFKNKIKNRNSNDIIFEVSASKITNNTTKINYTLNATDISKSNILEQCNRFINNTILRLQGY